jgi:anthranilate synthase
MAQLRYTTPSGITVTRKSSRLPFAKGLDKLLTQLDRKRGAYFSSGYEYPERYSRWDIATVSPPLELIGRGRVLEIRALNQRGRVLNQLLARTLRDHPHWAAFEESEEVLRGELKPLPEVFPEEDRSKQPTPFSILRALIQEFQNPADNRLFFAGAFGYDLLLEFDPIRMRLPRQNHKGLHLFLCDDIYFMDRRKEVIDRYTYDFASGELTTAGLPHDNPKVPKPKARAGAAEIGSDHVPEEYMRKVEIVREGMRQGNYYEVVLRQTFSAPFGGSVADLFRRVETASPSPYEFVLQMGDEQLVGASPEMFVRVEGRRVESCPIAGTARRSGDPLTDAESIRDLLNSTKEESELTMCSDVDRNDKSRVCIPGSVKVIGRRLIESYAGLFHTVDHVEGTLLAGFDSLDAFLTHMWAVTIIGAPKKAAAQAIEDLELDARGWYGGAVGMVCLNGDINTGILIRTVHVKDGQARYSAGATLLYDSVPESEEQETRLKATNFFRSLQPRIRAADDTRAKRHVGEGVRLLLVDNDDCFIHTLANYARQTGASVSTYRSAYALQKIDESRPDIVLISPGPARPEDFGVPALVRGLAKRGIPIFGVCLGLQGIVEAFGGTLDVLDYPMHGKRSVVHHQGKGVFHNLPEPFRVGRYHSLHANRANFPACLEITAESEDGIVMGLRHRDLPIEAVQFHPESILTLEFDCGLRLMENMIELYAHAAAPARS